MRNILMRTLLALLLMALCFSVGQAQAFVGITYEGQPGLIISGKVIPISEKISTLGYVRVSLDSGGYDNGLKTQHSIALKLTYHLIDKPTTDFYLVGGPSCDWANVDATKSLKAYITEAVGGVLTHRASFLDHIPLLSSVFDEPELWASLEFRPQLFDKDSRWQDKGVIGFGIKGGV